MPSEFLELGFFKDVSPGSTHLSCEDLFLDRSHGNCWVLKMVDRTIAVAGLSTARKMKYFRLRLANREYLR